MNLQETLELAKRLTLEEKVALLTGRDFWHVNGNEKVGLRPMLLSDGPSGVRGKDWDARAHSLNLPSSSALGATWSIETAKLYGEILGREASRKGADVVLGPTINLHRAPYGGRHFECMSEDPCLTAHLAVSYIKGLQSQDVASCPKHYICNDSETDRMSINIKVDDQTLNELYLRPFEDAITEGNAWSIMSSYNQVNGVTLTENDLLDTPLKDQWEFDGVVISDWTAVRSLNSAKKGQDLVMPGPMGPWGDALVAAVKSGEIAESLIDDKVARILLLASRTGALGKTTPSVNVEDKRMPSASELANLREIAKMGTVLTKNSDALPLIESEVASIGVFGHNADLIRTQGGGSATVYPVQTISVVDALKERLGNKVKYAMGAQVFNGIQELPRASIKNPRTGEQGLDVQLFGPSGDLIYQDNPVATTLAWIGGDAPLHMAHLMKISTTYLASESGKVNLGFATTRNAKITVNGSLHLSGRPKSTSSEPFQDMIDPPVLAEEFTIAAGESYLIELEVDLSDREGMELFAMTFSFGFVAKDEAWQDLVAEAVNVAKSTALSIVVVGTNAKVESEGFDRETLKLPGRQDELVEAVALASKKTIVIVNAGSPVLMPWLDKVDAVLLTFFGGQETGHAIADVIFGDSEPAGRMPTTWPLKESDLPVSQVTPTNGALEYREDLDIGYRAWKKSGAKPAFSFGSGLSYTTFKSDVAIDSLAMNGAEVIIPIQVRNTGSRRGRVVIQAYVEQVSPSVNRASRWLVGWADSFLTSSESKELQLALTARELRYWKDGWNRGTGTYRVLLGYSVDEIFHEIKLEVS